MERRIFVVLLFMAAIAAYGSDRSVQRMGFEDQHFAGPVCLPGDPCGWPNVIQELLNGPVCYPGDPCGPWPGGSWINFSGPMCFPGDPCGPGGVLVNPLAFGPRVSVKNFSGPMCFPGDPCGPGGVLVGPE